MPIKKWQFIKKPTEKWLHCLEAKIASDSRDDIILLLEKMKEVVKDKNINIDFEEGLKLAYRNKKDFANLNKLIFQDKTDALIGITRKRNNSKVEELFKDLGGKVNYINKRVIVKQYKYLNIVIDIALTLR